MKTFLLILILAVTGCAQTHKFPALDTDNVFTGQNLFVTPATSDNSTKVATTAYVKANLAGGSGSGTVEAGTAHDLGCYLSSGTTMSPCGSGLTFNPSTKQLYVGIPFNDPSFDPAMQDFGAPGAVSITTTTPPVGDIGLSLQVQGGHPAGIQVITFGTALGENDGIAIEAGGSANSTSVYGITSSPWQLTGGTASDIAGYLFIPQNQGGMPAVYSGMEIGGFTGIGTQNNAILVGDMGASDYVINAGTGKVKFSGLKSTTGTRFVCVDTSGALISSASPCSGT